MKNITLLKRSIVIGLAIIWVLFVMNFLGLFDTIKMKNALEEKYNEKFVVKGLRISINIFGGYNTAYAYSKSYPTLWFPVYYEKDGESDHYVDKRIAYKMSNEITENLNKYLDSDFYVYSELWPGGATLEELNLSVKEYLEKEPIDKVYITLLFDKKNLTTQKLVDALNGTFNNYTKFNGGISIFIMDSRKLKKAKKYLETHDKPYYEFDELTDDSSLKAYPLYKDSTLIVSYYDINEALKEKNIVLE